MSDLQLCCRESIHQQQDSAEEERSRMERIGTDPRMTDTVHDCTQDSRRGMALPLAVGPDARERGRRTVADELVVVHPADCNLCRDCQSGIPAR